VGFEKTPPFFCQNVYLLHMSHLAKNTSFAMIRNQTTGYLFRFFPRNPVASKCISSLLNGLFAQLPKNWRKNQHRNMLYFR